MALGGCATGLKGSPARTIDEQHASSCPVTVTKGTGVSTMAATRTAYDAPANAAKRKEFRDEFIDRCVAAINGSYGVFADSLRSDQKSFSIGAETLGTGFTSAAALAKSARTKTFLATYATFVLGLKGTVDKELFVNQALSALKAQMAASRAKVMVEITKGKALSDAEYSLNAAIFHLQTYYEAGTLDGALSSINVDAGAKSLEAQQQIVSLSSFKYANDTLNKSLRKYLQPDGLTVDTAHQATLIACTPVVPGTTATPRDMGRILEAGSADLRDAMARCVKGKDPNFNYTN